MFVSFRPPRARCKREGGTPELYYVTFGLICSQDLPKYNTFSRFLRKDFFRFSKINLNSIFKNDLNRENTGQFLLNAIFKINVLKL